MSGSGAHLCISLRCLHLVIISMADQTAEEMAHHSRQNDRRSGDNEKALVSTRIVHIRSLVVLGNGRDALCIAATSHRRYYRHQA